MANKAIDKHYLLETLKDFYTTILLTFFQKKLAVATVPSDPENGDVIIYTGITSGDFIQGHTYKYSSLPDEWTDITPAGSGGGTWGSITGTLSDQTDLQEVLDEKAVAIKISQPEYDALSESDKNDPSKVYFLKGEDYFKEVTISSVSSDMPGTHVWTDGTNTYYSYFSSQYRFNGDLWVPMTWTGLTEFNGKYVWTDGTNIYYSDSTSSTQYKLNGTTWEVTTFSGLTYVGGNRIWTDGTNIYYSNGTSGQYKLNGTTWESMTWSGYNNIQGEHVWFNNNDIYYSRETVHYKLNGTTWEAVTWTGLTNFYGEDIWNTETNIYYSYPNTQYKLNGTTWEPMEWIGVDTQYFSGSNIWKYNDDYYFSNKAKLYSYPAGIYYRDILYASGNEGAFEWGTITGTLSDQTDLQTVLDEKAIPIKLSTAEYNSLSPSDKNDSSKIYFVADKDNSISTMTWSGLTNFYGSCVWTDGTNIYYSYGSNQYKLNGTTWETMSWTGPSLFVPNGNKIWTDGSNIYYSDQNFQCKLNGTTWGSMTWTGLTSFQGDQVWTDGTNIYYSYNGSSLSGQYKLNGTTWESMTWTGLTDFNGNMVWTDGTDTYYSYNSTQYKLNGTTWETMTWSGHSNFSGNNVWSDGSDVYYSYQSVQYKLDGTTWEDITWDGLTTFNGFNIWTDGNYYYYSNESNQYIVNAKAKEGTKVIYYKDTDYSSGAITLNKNFASNADHVDIDISSLNIDTNNYTLKYFSTVKGLEYTTESYNSSTGIFTVGFKKPTPSAGTFYIEAHKANG